MIINRKTMRKLRLINIWLGCCLAVGAQAAELAKAPMRYQLQGEMIQGAMIVGLVPQGTKIALNKRTLPISEAGDFVFGLGRDSLSGDVLHFYYADGREDTLILSVKPRKYQIQRVNGISAEIVSDQKSEATWQRIQQEQVAVDAAKAKFFPQLWFKQSFIWPLRGRISGVFGSQRVYNGVPGTPHFGVDIAAAVGTPFVAPANGIVTLAEPNLYFSGGTIILDHGFQVSSSFLHMSKVLVKVGDVVKQGDVLGEVGATGRASGPHLDWRMTWQDRRIDPQLLVPAMPKP